MIGIVVGMLGVVVVLLTEWENRTDSDEEEASISTIPGYILGIMASFFWSFTIVMWGRTRIDSRTGQTIPSELAACSSAVFSVLVNIFIMYTYDWIAPPKDLKSGLLFFLDFSWKGVICLLYLGILSGFASGMAFLQLANKAGPVVANQTQALVPIWALVLGVAFHDEWDGIDWKAITIEISGVVLAIVGIMLTLKKKKA